MRLRGPKGERYRQSCIVRQANDRVDTVGDIAKQHVSRSFEEALNIAVVQTSRKLFPKKKGLKENWHDLTLRVRVRRKNTCFTAMSDRRATLSSFFRCTRRRRCYRSSVSIVFDPFC